jgi:hypothetical protein
MNLDVFLFSGEKCMESEQIIIPDVLKGKTFLDPGYGPAFRKMLEPKEVMADFINSILHLNGCEEVVDLASQFERPIDTFYPENKTLYFDAHVTTRGCQYLNIELQNAHHAFFVDRSLIYNAHHVIHSKRDFEIARKNEKIVKNEIMARRYELPQIISVWICKFSPRPEVEHDDFRDYWGIYSGNDLAKGRTLPVSEKIKYLIIDLPKFIKTHPAIDTRESFWLHLIACGVEAMPPTNDPIFRQAIENLRIVNASQELLNRQEKAMTYNYEHEVDDYEAIIKDLVSEASQAAAEKREDEIAREMLADNEPLEKIVRYLHLSKERIMELKAELESVGV